ncbi:MAG: aa3-type cytochrome c oxidase subunit IV [Paracoccaceae bacterium]
MSRIPPRDTGIGIGYQQEKTREGNRIVAEHKQGSMNISVQEKTFAGFIRMVTWGAAISIGVLIFLALANA